MRFATTVVVGLGAGCKSLPPIETVNHVDLDRFMGKWYVVAHIPTFLEDTAHNATESYERDADGGVVATFRFNDGGLDGDLKEHRFPGRVRDHESNAVWGVQIFWPFEAEYRVIYLDDDYSQTVIGRSKRDYVWIMARTPSIPAADYERLLALIEERGYSLEGMREVPHGKPDESSGP